MKNFFLSFFAVTLLFMLISCHSSKPINEAVPGGSEMLYQYKWYLTELQGQPFTFIGNDNYAHLLFSAGQPNKVTGSTGCNRLNGSYDLTGVNFVKFSPIVTTRMACEGKTEAQFIEALAQVNNWSIFNEQLLLGNGKIVVAKLNAVSMETDKLSGTWNLNYISGLKISFDGLYPDKKPTIAFNFSTKELGGNTTCNGFSSKFTINRNNIHFADALKTMIFCEGGGEEAFLSILKKVNKYSVNDNTLTFLTDDVAIMRFAKK
ncbi:MAG: META domain-containing protein [Chitinophagaceae bacterium]